MQIRLRLQKQLSVTGRQLEWSGLVQLDDCDESLTFYRTVDEAIDELVVPLKPPGTRVFDMTVSTTPIESTFVLSRHERRACYQITHPEMPSERLIYLCTTWLRKLFLDSQPEKLFVRLEDV